MQRLWEQTTVHYITFVHIICFGDLNYDIMINAEFWQIYEIYVIISI